jgi:hypothetical protein
MSDKNYYLEQISECEAKIASARPAIAKINAATQEAATSGNYEQTGWGGMRRSHKRKSHTKRRHHSKRRRTVRRR